MVRLNAFGQPIGKELPNWRGARQPEKIVRMGRYCRLEPISALLHSKQLYLSFNQAADQRDWTYLLSGPFLTLTDYQTYLSHLETCRDPLHYAIMDMMTQQAVGTVALMRIDSFNGVIEIGSVIYSSSMKRTRIATEVIFLLLTYVFGELGYRRLEWKCDALNAPSRAAAKRFGFTYEGLFRQAVVTRGRNRDTTWYSIIDSEYPALKRAYAQWLLPANFNAQGVQRSKLSKYITEQRAKSCYK
ncbi:hypothetical protein COMNV_00942 [Commensalibacter sp. Nvir]|uniref:GNAT family N-acetyltransferase n=1 Tax=Commensalibacter sp. Nvir TaxID=3069817 RepID=UPI002D2AB299|nr:hypothetical protein COMNV_00942 [Commensalibacter sp. Nvir]